jgi:hypothetical protein
MVTETNLDRLKKLYLKQREQEGDDRKQSEKELNRLFYMLTQAEINELRAWLRKG